MQKLAHAASGDVVFRMRIRVYPLETLQVTFDETQATTGGGVIAIHHQAFAEWRVERGIDADDLLAQELPLQAA